MPWSAGSRRCRRSAFIASRASLGSAAVSSSACLATGSAPSRSLIAGLTVQALAIVAYAFVSQLGEFYALAAIFGTAYGGVMPLYVVLAREYFGQRIMGTVFGAATMVSSMGMAFGPLIGGWVYDAFNGYAWLFIGSAAVGLGGMFVALVLPPLPRARLQPA
jgi:MFS family permease